MIEIWNLNQISNQTKSNLNQTTNITSRFYKNGFTENKCSSILENDTTCFQEATLKLNGTETESVKSKTLLSVILGNDLKFDAQIP